MKYFAFVLNVTAAMELLLPMIILRGDGMHCRLLENTSLVVIIHLISRQTPVFNVAIDSFWLKLCILPYCQVLKLQIATFIVHVNG